MRRLTVAEAAFCGLKIEAANRGLDRRRSNLAVFMPGRASRVLATVAAGVFLAGCGSSGTATPVPATTPPAASVAPPTAVATSSTAASAQPTPGAIIAAIKSAGVIRIGVALDSLPWLGYDSKNNLWFGAGNDVAVAVADALGVKIQYVQTTFGTFVAGLQANQFDMFVAPADATPERLAVVDMTNYSTAGYCYLVKASNTQINTLADLNSPNVTFAQFQGVATTQIVEQKYPLAKNIVRAQGSGEDADIISLQAGRANVAPFDSFYATFFQKKFPDLKVIPSDCLTNPDLAIPTAVAYNKGDGGLQALVASTITAIQPQIDADMAKYSTDQYLSAVP